MLKEVHYREKYVELTAATCKSKRKEILKLFSLKENL